VILRGMRLIKLKKIMKRNRKKSLEQEVEEIQMKLEKISRRLYVMKAIDIENPHDIMEVIISSDNVMEAKEKLKVIYNYSDVQVQEICDMRLKVFTKDNRREIKDEILELQAETVRLEERINNDIL